MDRWKYSLKSVRKENGFENLKTRFQDCNLSRKQESKPDGMIKENKLSLQKENNHSGFRAFNMEQKKTIRQSVRM